MSLPCSVAGCAGEYEEREIVHLMKHHGEPIVIDHVPAQVCLVCGDILFTLETVEAIQTLLRDAPAPARSIPLYEYA